jgi:WD40 repeat protein
MRCLLLLLLALFVAVPLVQADTPAKDEPEKPAPEPPSEPELETPPGKLTLAIDPGRHTAWILKVAFTPDSKNLIVASHDRSIAVWDVKTGQRLRVLRAPGGAACTCLALSPDGNTLALGYYYREEGKASPYTICLMSLADGRVERLLRGHTKRIHAVVFSPDGKRLASCSTDKTVRLWNLAGKDESEKVINTDRIVHGLAFSPTGTRLAEITHEHGAMIRDLANGKVVTTLKSGKVATWFGCDSLIAWSRDGKTLATCAEDGLRLWEPDGKLRHHLLRPTGGFVWANLAFSADSKKLIGTDSGKDRVVIFDVVTGKEEKKSYPAIEARRCVFSPDGKLIAAVGWKDVVDPGRVHGVCEVLVWSTDDGKRLQRIASPGWLSGEHLEAGWSSDGNTVSWRRIDKTGEWKGGPTAFDLKEFQLVGHVPVKSLQGPVFKQGSLTLKVLNNKTVDVLKNGKHHASFKSPGPNIGTYLVKHPLTFPVKDKALLLDGHSCAYLFDVHTGKQLQALKHPGRPYSAAGSPDGRFLVTLDADQILHIWNLQTGERLLALFVRGEDWIAWTKAGYYAASPGGEKLVGWVVDNGSDQAPSFHPAQRFRKQFYQPELLRKVLELGSMENALAAAGIKAQDVEQVLPPQATLRLTEQKEGKVSVEVVAQAGCKGQPISELHLQVDGRPVQLDDKKLASVTFAPALEKNARATWTVTLEPGPHTLRARAGCKDIFSMTDEVAFEVPRPMAAPANNKQGTLYYLGVGVNKFQHHKELELNGAVPDVENLARCLKAISASRFADFQPIVLTDARATRAAILKELTDLKAKLKANDVVIVHYSSHGEVDKENGLFLLTHDTRRDSLKDTALSGFQLRDILGEYTSQVLLILDACHSGKFPVMRPPTDPLSRLLADDNCGVAVMTAALAHQKAQDGVKGGVFTLALVDGLAGKARPEEETKKLYLHHLFSYVFDEVTKKTGHQQMPLYLPSGSVQPIVIRVGEGK